jgi:hypothetical protein
LSYKEKREYDGLEGEIENDSARVAELQKLLDSSHRNGAEYSAINEVPLTATRILTCTLRAYECHSHGQTIMCHKSYRCNTRTVAML